MAHRNRLVARGPCVGRWWSGVGSDGGGQASRRHHDIRAYMVPRPKTSDVLIRQLLGMAFLGWQADRADSACC
eukprot:1154902-Pelagomonas_calceolata.AAC.1